MTNMQILAMDRTGETGDIIFRDSSACSMGGEALTDKQVDAALKAWFAIDDTYYEPSFRQRMRAAIAAATEGAA